MELEYWYKTVTPRKEVREGRSFNPDEFAIALEQVVAGTAPEDYQDPNQFFGRTCFTRALKEHAGMVLRRLAGETANTAPVITLVTQFGGGKTHTLAALYHLARNGKNAASFPGVAGLLQEARLSAVPQAKVAVFVGNAWDPQEGHETPWIDIARQLAGDEGVKALGTAAEKDPPGTDTINRLIELAGGPVLLLFDEVLNGLARHKWLAEPFHAFMHNIMRGFVSTHNRVAVISLPRSQTEMTDWDLQWQDKILKIVGAVAKPVIVNDEAEISEVLRRRLFESLGKDRARRLVSKAFADWCFERRAQLPPEYTAIVSPPLQAGEGQGGGEVKAREFLQNRFEACYPFHPATLSVFQRKWQTLPQYQQTRGTLAMLAQWISWAYRDAFTHARHEPLITLGSAPLDVPEFRSVVLGQLGESRLMAAIEADIAGAQAHARTLDVDTKDALQDIHRRVGAAIFFESSGGQADKVAHLPELRFALCEPEVDTTSVDTAAFALEARAYYVRRVGSDGFRVHHQPTLKKVVNERRASLDAEAEVRPAMRKLVQAEFDKGRSIPAEYFRSDSANVSDSPKLTLQVMEPALEWSGAESSGVRERILNWTKQKGVSPRLHPGALVWCLKKPGRELHEKVETWLAWKHVKRDLDEGTLGGEFDHSELTDIQGEVRDAEEEARNEVWASYRFVVLADAPARAGGQEESGLRVIDLGAGHSSTGQTLCGRVIDAMKSQSLLNESPGAGYLDRRWPPAFKDTGAWPLMSLRQAFLTGALDRLLDPDAYLRSKIPEFVERGDFGLASGQQPDGTYEHVWYKEPLPADEVAFESDVYLLKKAKAQELKFKPTCTLTVQVAGNGSVTRIPNQATYVPGTVVTLQATPDPGRYFVGWSGDVTDAANPVHVTASDNLVVTAAFAQTPPQAYALTVNVGGNGSVTSTPSQTTYASGTVVKLQANPDPGWHFAGWSGGLTGADNPASITVDGNMTITATFTTSAQVRQLHLFGDLPPETWNRLGTKLIPKLRSGQDLKVQVDFTLTVGPDASSNLVVELKQILNDLVIADQVKIEMSDK